MPDTPRAWRTVLDKIEADLVSGSLHPGDRLPGERQLAAELGVGRSSVREAIRVLDAMGLVQTNVGSGPQAGAIIVARPDGGMSMLMRLQVAATGFAVDDIVSSRVLLETAVVASLASRFAPPGSLIGLPIIGARAAHDHYFGQVIAQATRQEPALLRLPGEADGTEGSGTANPRSPESDPTPAPTPTPTPETLLADAERILDRMDAATDAATFLSLDTRFHLRLAEAAGNQVISATMSGLRGAVESYVTEGIPAFPDWPATAARLQREHRDVIASIRAGDQPLATRLIRRHIEDYFSDISLHRSEPPLPDPAAAPATSQTNR
ncbi:FadR/GntR family transcriptional regulator [Mycetocola reblochoni]|uniref:Lactate-responsive regulator LldR in Actinobacteria, GntR family n=1 Tax=Mycetocola reblochoni REB411 TaxID=1255698 RepID=A0A1R4ISU8_9MICO|nr:FCD domain-containing protein [Mycetocola reblochoni]SJN22940.1 Lactate-responsive regulator LldR in Actinobacteria, GntR family [Mycetocola reblochoni REB411]